jgi:hypothetical protein
LRCEPAFTWICSSSSSNNNNKSKRRRTPHRARNKAYQSTIPTRPGNRATHKVVNQEATILLPVVPRPSTEREFQREYQIMAFIYSGQNATYHECRAFFVPLAPIHTARSTLIWAENWNQSTDHLTGKSYY